MIECSLMEIPDNPWRLPHSNKAKYGLYSSSFHWSVSGFGLKCWVVIVNIDVDCEKYIAEGKTIEEIATECVKYLNMPPKSKYGKRRKRKPLYEFEPAPFSYSIKEKEDKTYISAMLLIKQKKNKYFWGQGEKYL